MYVFSKGALLPGDTIEFGICVPQGERFGTFRDRGEAITEADFDELRDLEYRVLYVSEADADAAWDFLADRIDRVLTDTALTNRQLIEILFHTSWRSVRLFETEPTRRHYEILARMAAAIIECTAKEASVILEFLRLAGLQRHHHTSSAHVAALAAAIAGDMDAFTPIELECLVLACLVRDVGMSRLPREILECRGKLNVQQRLTLADHVRHSANILEDARVGDPLVRTIVLEHHERFDGSGYPRSLMGDQIHPLSVVAGVADSFGALLTARTYRKPFAAYDGLRVLVEREHGRFSVGPIKSLVRLLSAAAAAPARQAVA